MIVNPAILNFDNAYPDLTGMFSSFELELPDFDTTLSRLQEDVDLTKLLGLGENQPHEASGTYLQLADARMNLVKSLQALAQKDKISVKMRSIDNTSLLNDTRKLFNAEREKRISLNSLSKDDIEFFKFCSEKNELTINEINPKNSNISFAALDSANQVSYKSINFSKGLFNLIEYAHKQQKPVRLDFQGDSSVILRISQKGRLSAEFVSNDTAMEHILRNNIPNLRTRLDSEGIPYEKIYYRDKQNKRDKGGKK